MRLGQLVKESRGDNWLIPRYQEYLKDRNVTLEAKHARDILDRPYRGPSGAWGASRVGQCLRAQLYKKRGAPAADPDAKSLQIFQEGHYVHLKHQAAGMTAGYLTQVEVEISMPELGVMGSVDGITSELAVAEFKSINPYGFSSVAQFGPKPEHLLQVNVYMEALGLDKAHLLYENKATQELQEFTVSPDPKLIERNHSDWAELSEYMETDTRPRMLSECQQEEGRYKWCPFAEVCMKDHRQERKSRIRLTSSSDGD